MFPKRLSKLYLDAGDFSRGEENQSHEIPGTVRKKGFFGSGNGSSQPALPPRSPGLWPSHLISQSLTSQFKISTWRMGGYHVTTIICQRRQPGKQKERGLVSNRPSASWAAINRRGLSRVTELSVHSCVTVSLTSPEAPCPHLLNGDNNICICDQR